MVVSTIDFNVSLSTVLILHCSLFYQMHPGEYPWSAFSLNQWPLPIYPSLQYIIFCWRFKITSFLKTIWLSKYSTWSQIFISWHTTSFPSTQSLMGVVRQSLFIDDFMIMSSSTHRDLGIILSADLSCLERSQHNLSRAYGKLEITLKRNIYQHFKK